MRNKQLSNILPRPVAFVFSGGTSLGSVQVGMLRAVFEAGIKPDLLVGTSAGAVNAASVGQGFTASRVEHLANIWSGLRTSDIFGGLGNGNPHLHDDPMHISMEVESSMPRLLLLH